jgi:hypothetical protein
MRHQEGASFPVPTALRRKWQVKHAGEARGQVRRASMHDLPRLSLAARRPSGLGGIAWKAAARSVARLLSVFDRSGHQNLGALVSRAPSASL